jgi:ATP-dependent Clp protease ATP-binding subunit ClpA
LSGDNIGFQKGAKGSVGKGVIERTFSPEFRNRLDAWIAFKPLEMPVIERVVDKFMSELSQQLVEKRVTVELTPAARIWLAVHGFDKLYGARPMARLIQQKIKEPLAEQILFGQLQHGGSVVIDELNGELTIRSNPAES